MNPTKWMQKCSHSSPHPFGRIGMHFANAIAIIVTSPFLDGMTDSGMGTLELVIAVRFIGVDLSIGLGELINMPTEGGTCRIADDAQPHLPALSPNRPDDGGTVVDIGSRPCRLFARRRGGSAGSQCSSPFFPRILKHFIGFGLVIG